MKLVDTFEFIFYCAVAAGVVLVLWLGFAMVPA